MLLDEKIAKQIKDLYETMKLDGRLSPESKLDEYYQIFRSKFSPEQLNRLDGPELLSIMHDSGNRDSLVYWLEFKDDEEFPARFGSIAGGSALKFGIYRRHDTGVWMTGTPQKQREITIDEAIHITRNHLEQFVKGIKLLESLPDNAKDEDYSKLQQDMDRDAPDICNTSWGHKYFSLLFPDKLDDFHNPEYQRFHLIKLLQVPPQGEGRYLVAGRYVAISKELHIRLHLLTSILYQRIGRPYKYWRIGTRSGDTHESWWDRMMTGNYIAIGWAKVGDLSWVEYKQESKDRLRELVRQYYGKDRPGVVGGSTQRMFNFVASINEDDIVLAADGSKVFGIGRVNGGYSYEPSSGKQHDWPHRKPVDWIYLDEWKLPDEQEGLQHAVYELRKPNNLIEIERRLLTPSTKYPERPPKPPKLSGIPGRIQDILERKKQVILYGPPGTGKTYWALQTAKNLAAIATFNVDYASLNEGQRKVITGDLIGNAGLVRLCTFHPAYGYEDFIEGYRPQAIRDQLSFVLKNGMFKQLCEDAKLESDRCFFLIIDEINRGDIPRIFGELLTILEKDKRGQPNFLPISGQVFNIPEKIYIIGTMNTADRSIALLDTALRRRFGFIEIMPDSSILGDTIVGGIPLGPWLEALNRHIVDSIGRDARNLQVGHAYLLDDGKPVSTYAKFARILEDDILPLLEEYCYEDYEALEKILGKGLVDRDNQRIRHELFEPNRQDDLIQALIALASEITTLATSVDIVEGMLNEEEESSENDES
jgi:5-methylcytosine-specific restriction protein B